MFDFLRFAMDFRVATLSSGHHHCHEGWVQTHCPQCTDGRFGWHLGWSKDKGNLNCWRCGPVRVVDYLRGAARTTVERALDLRRQYDSKKGKRVAKAARQRRHATIPPGLGPLGEQHTAYLLDPRPKGRGLRDLLSLVELWDLQATRHLSGDWNWRIVSPIYGDSPKHPVAYIGRSIVSKMKPKYKVSDDGDCASDPKGFLYGINRVPGEAVIIVEGPGDVWNVGPGAVATMSHGWHPEQANRIRKFKRRYVMYDPDEKAQRDAQKLADWLSTYPGETEIVDGLKTDPGDMEHREVRRLRKELGIGELT